MEYKNQLKIVILGELPDLNQYTNANRSSKFGGGTLKKASTELVEWECKRQLKYGYKVIPEPVFVEFHWYCKNRKKDKDNVAFAKKFILDGLQKAKVILQDNWKAIIGFSDTFEVDAEDPRIEIIIKYN